MLVLTGQKVHVMDLQEDFINQGAMTLTPGHICPVVHTILQIVVVAAKEDERFHVLQWWQQSK